MHIPIVGLDLSTTNSGLAVVRSPTDVKYLSIKPDGKEKESTDLLFYSEQIAEMALALGGPDACAYIENTYMGANAKVSIMLAELRGMVMTGLYDRGITCFARPMPSEVKAWATGNGGARKEEMIGIVQTWGYTVPTKTSRSKALDDNVADAIAIAMYGWAYVNGSIDGIGLDRLLKR